METSRVPAVMTTLKALLQARPALAGVQITDGRPWQPDSEYIAILDAEPHEQEAAALARTRQPRNEEFTLQVEINVARSGDADHTEIVARAYALAAELENELRQDVTLGGALGPSGWALIAGLPIVKGGPDSGGARDASIFARIACRARI